MKNEPKDVAPTRRGDAPGRPETSREEEARDTPLAIERHARDAIEKSAVELRKQHVPIETEPPTVYRP